MDLTAVDFEQADGDRQGETARTGAARIEIEHAAAALDERSVRMARDDDMEPGYRGIDIEAGYNMPLDMLLADAGGDLSFRFMATHYIKAYQNTGLSKPTDTAGQNNGTGAVPNWRWRASAGYTNETVSLSLTARGITSGTYLNSNVECTTGCPISTADNRTVDNNRIAGAVYLDTSMSYKFGVAETDMEVFFNVKNVLNTEPAVVAPGPGGFTYEAPAANATLYDTLGRVFRAGVRFRM